MPDEPPSDLPDLMPMILARRWAIVPARRGYPLTENLLEDTSADPDQWARWTSEYPGCGWVLPTGTVNDVDVILARDADAVSVLRYYMPPGPTTWTSGGNEYFFLRHLKGSLCWWNRIPATFFRGSGGMVPLPTVNDALDRRRGWWTPNSDLPLPEQPAWLQELHRIPPGPRGRWARSTVLDEFGWVQRFALAATAGYPDYCEAKADAATEFARVIASGPLGRRSLRMALHELPEDQFDQVVVELMELLLDDSQMAPQWVERPAAPVH